MFSRVTLLYVMSVLTLYAGEANDPDLWRGYGPPEDNLVIVRSAGHGIAGYTEEEKKRMLSRPDIIRVVADQAELTASQVYILLKSNPGKKVAWFHRITSERYRDSYEATHYYSLAPKEGLKEQTIAWRANAEVWQELLVKPPIGSWFEVRVGPTSSYSGPWGAGQRVYDTPWGRIWETSQELQNEAVAKPDGLLNVVIHDHRHAISDEERTLRLADPIQFSGPFAFEKELLANNVVIQRALKFPDGDTSRSVIWWSGSRLVSVRGSRLKQADEVVQRYLTKHPSTLPVDFTLSAEGWTLQYLDFTVRKLEEVVEAQDVHLGATDQQKTFEFVIRATETLLAEFAVISRKYLNGQQVLYKTHIADKKYDWIPYQENLFALRRDVLRQLREIVLLASQRGIRYNDKRLAFEIKSE